MRLARIPILALAIGLVGAACDNTEAPTSIEIDIDEIQIRPGVCAIPEGATCSVQAEAKAQGIVVANPVLRWSSSNTTVASVEVGSNNSTATVRGLSLGSATIRVENTNGDAFDEVRASVLPCSKC